MISFAMPFFSGAGEVRAKNIDYTPDITSDSYWNDHYIGIARVSKIAREGREAVLVTYVVTRTFSNGAMQSPRTVRASELWFGKHGDEPPGLAENQELVLYQAKRAREPLVAAPVEEASRAHIAALVHIARLRSDPGPTPPVMESAFDGNELISRYSLRRLLDGPSFRPPAGYVDRLVQLRDQQSRPVECRIFAARLSDKLEGRHDGSDTEYAWLKEAIPGTPAAEWTDLKPLVDRIVQFERKRPEIVRLLTDIVRQQNAARALRIAAYSVFDDPRMFQFEAPDQRSDLIFETCIQILNDPDPVFRGAGAALTHNLAVRVSQRHRFRYLERAKQAIQTARERESDPATRSQFDHFLKLLAETPTA